MLQDGIVSISKYWLITRTDALARIRTGPNRHDKITDDFSYFMRPGHTSELGMTSSVHLHNRAVQVRT